MTVRLFFTFLLLKKRGLDRASKSGKFAKNNESMTPVLCINTASCGKNFLRISGHITKLIIDKFSLSDLATQRQVLFAFLLCFS